MQLVQVSWGHLRKVDGADCKGQICQDSGSCCPCPGWVCCQHFSATTPTCMQAESECPIPAYYNSVHARKSAAPHLETGGVNSTLTTCCPGPICNGCCCPSAGYVCCPDGDSCAKTPDACAGVAHPANYPNRVKLIMI